MMKNNICMSDDKNFDNSNNLLKILVTINNYSKQKWTKITPQIIFWRSCTKLSIRYIPVQSLERAGMLGMVFEVPSPHCVTLRGWLLLLSTFGCSRSNTVCCFWLSITPSSFARFVAVSTAVINDDRKPVSSNLCMAAIVVPPGEHTSSLSCPGCFPDSSTIFAAPCTNKWWGFNTGKWFLSMKHL